MLPSYFGERVKIFSSLMFSPPVKSARRHVVVDGKHCPRLEEEAKEAAEVERVIESTRRLVEEVGRLGEERFIKQYSVDIYA